MSGRPETDEGRPENLRLGTETYSIVTRIDDAGYGRVASLVRSAFDVSPRSMPQEQRLLLACLRLAHELDRISQKLREIDGISS